MSLRFLGQDIGRRLKILNAGVMELADVTDSKSVGLITRVGSSPTTGTMKHWQKRYYAHKRLYKAICGHKSCEKQEFSSVDIFDTKVDLNPPMGTAPKIKHKRKWNFKPAPSKKDKEK